MKRFRHYAIGTIDHVDGPGGWLATALTCLGLAAAWALALRSGSLTAVSRHWFYLPVVFAAVRFGPSGALVVGTAAGLLAGPAVVTAEGAVTAYGVWVPRAAFFLGVGTFVGALTTVVRDGQRRAALLIAQQNAQRERLDYQRAALIQTVSHEFRTPLTVLHGGIRTLDVRREEVSQRIRPLIAGLVRAEARLSEMVSVVLATADALDASQGLDSAPVVLDRLVRETVAALDQFDGSTRVTTRIDADAEVVVTVPAYLQVALRCVLENALKFSPRDRDVVVTAARRTNAVTIAVQDRGSGIDPDFLDRAFQPFTQADDTSERTHGGLGIGLYTARSIVERLGGSVHVADSTPEDGSTLVIELPQQRDADGARRARGRGRHAVAAHRPADPPEARIDGSGSGGG